MGAVWQILTLLVLNLYSADLLASEGTQSRPKFKPGPQKSTSKDLFVNLSAVRDWSTQQAFLNEFRKARTPKIVTKWNSGSPSNFGTVEIGSDYYVKSFTHWSPPEPGKDQIAVAYGFNGTNVGHKGIAEPGRRRFSFNGQGTFEFFGDVANVVQVSSNVYEFDLLMSNTLNGAFTVVQLSTGDSNQFQHARDFILSNIDKGVCLDDFTISCNPQNFFSCGMASSCINSHDAVKYLDVLFSPDFIESLNMFGGIRFMDWGGTNWSPLEHWSDRPHMSDAVWTSIRGVPYEVMIRLANETNSHPWVSIPHKASNNFIGQLTALFRNMGGLNPDLTLHLEYSNELWNLGPFGNQGTPEYPEGQALWAYNQGQSKFAGQPIDPFQKFRFFVVDRAFEVLKLAKDFYYGQPQSRLKTVFGGQAGSEDVFKIQFDRLAFQNKNPNDAFDALAIAPYLGLHDSKYSHGDEKLWELLDWDIQKFNSFLVSGIPALGIPSPILGVTQTMFKFADLAHTYKLEPLAYEGGPHFLYPNIWNCEPGTPCDKVTEKYLQAQRDPSFSTPLFLYMQSWVNAGGYQFSYFSDCDAWTKHGAWGIREFMGDHSSIKLKTLKDFTSIYTDWANNL